MAFPTNDTLLDDYNRANGGVGANYTNLLNTLVVSSNQLAGGTAAAANIGMWDVSTFGQNWEIRKTLVTLQDAASMGLFGGITTLDIATFDGYYAEYLFVPGGGNDTIGIYRVDNGVPTLLGSLITLECSAGHKLGMARVGNVIFVYKDTGSGYSDVSSGGRTDTTYMAAGYVGVIMEGTTVRADDLFGGTAIAGNPYYAYAQQ